MIASKISKIIVIFIFIAAIFFLGVLSWSYFLKFSKVTLQFKNSQDEYVKLLKEKKELNEDYIKQQKDYEKKENELQGHIRDRENLLNQIKELLPIRNRAKELEVSLEDAKKDVGALGKQRLDLIEWNTRLRKKIVDLEIIQKQLIKEKEALKQTVQELRDQAFLKKLEQEKASLQKDNADLNTRLKQAQVDYTKLKETASKTKEELGRTIKEANALKEQLNKLNNDYALAVNKNRALEQRVTVVPDKFSEIARQNKVLIRQTANMHYNLGVFYTKQKEYTRAITEFEKALELKPDDAYSHFNLGYIYAEYVVDRPRAIEHFRQYLRLAKKDDNDIDWVKKYLITWETWQGSKPLE